MNKFAKERLMSEKELWRKQSIPSFFASPASTYIGMDIFKWNATIPGKKGTDWEGADYHLTIEFSSDYPVVPPICTFVDPIFHPNVYPSGKVCIGILGDLWKMEYTVKDILVAIQEFLNSPNIKSPAQKEAYEVYRDNKEMYALRVREQAKAIAERYGKKYKKIE